MFCIVDHFRSDLAVVHSFVFDAVFALQYPLFDPFCQARVVIFRSAFLDHFGDSWMFSHLSVNGFQEFCAEVFRE